MSGSRMSGVFARLRREELGATSVIVLLLMTVLLISAALVVDVGAIQARRAQLQDAADAAALAIAQECFEHPASSALGCAGSVVSDAGLTAAELAVANVNDGRVTAATPVFTGDTVRVTLASTQEGYFGVFAGQDDKDLTATAVARWEQQAVPLSLAMASCAFPAPGEETVLQSALAVPAVLSGAIGDSCGIVDSEPTFQSLAILPILAPIVSLIAGLFPTIPNLNGTTGVVAGGWLATGDCTYDPNLLTTVSATVSKLIPPDCADVVADWNVSAGDPQRVLLPVFDNGLDQLVLDDVLGVGDVDRYAVVDVTAYSFSGLLGLGTVAGSDASLCRSTDSNLGDGVLDAVSEVTGSVPLLGPWLVSNGGATGLLNRITGCQALQGTFVGFVDSEEAAQLLVGVQLVE